MNNIQFKNKYITVKAITLFVIYVKLILWIQLSIEVNLNKFYIRYYNAM